MSSERATVLVVDDLAVNRKLVASALAADATYTILQACDGIDAQQVLSTVQVDVVVTDVMMPRLDGLALMRWAHTACPGPTWIIHSALDTFDAAVEALQLGAYDFVAKPLPSVRLIQRSVRNAVQQRQLEAERRRLRDTLAANNERLIAQVAELEALCRVMREQAETIQQDLVRAEGIQRALLPRMAPLVPGFAIDSIYRPSRNIGGDLYDVVRLDGRHVALYVADAAGHGVAAAMLSVLVKHRLRMTDPVTGRPRAPSDVLAGLNRVIAEECGAPGLFVTAVYAVLDTETGALSVASAGHPPIALATTLGRGSMTNLNAGAPTGPVRWLERTGPALGLGATASYGQHEVMLAHGDRLLLYTDGLCEPPSPTVDIEPIGCDEIAEALARGDGPTMLRDLLEAAKAKHAGRAIEDDVTIVMLTADDRVSTLDHDHPVSAAAAPVEAAAAPAVVSTGDTADATWVRIAGRGTWVHAGAVHAACAAAQQAPRAVVIDLASCTYLDSTLLGTLHDIVTHADAAAPVRIHGVRPEIRKLFDELAMQPVIDHIAAADRPAPHAMRPLDGTAESPDASRARILHAHELLLTLSEHNRSEFQAVVDALRGDR